MATKNSKKDAESGEREALLALARVTVAVRQFRAKHSEVFEGLATLERAEKLAGEAYKPLAKEHAKVGETVKLVDDEVATVLVIAPLTTGYDVDKARNEWPRKVFADVVAIDPKKVMGLIESGSLTGAEASRAAFDKELPVQVRIEIHGAKS